MTVTQIYQLLNDTAAEVYGSQAVSVLDLQGLISLRDTVLGSGTDNFLNTLVDRIGKTVLRTLDYSSEFPNFISDEYSFGAILQKVSVQPFSATEQLAWEVGQGGFNTDIYRIDKPTVYQDFFKDSAAWNCMVTIPDTMYKTAFTSAATMDAFITAIYDSIETSMRMQIDNVTRLAICAMIGEKVNANNGVVDLLSLYNTTAATPITAAADAMVSKDFLQFAGKTMRDYIKYMSRPSVLYNVPGRVRATARDNMHVLMLTEFTSAYDTYVKSVLFRPEDLPLYSEITYFQGTGATAPNFDDCSNVHINIPSDGTEVDQAGVVGLFCDREAIATGYFDRFSAVDRNNRDRFSNFTSGCTIQSIVDTSENAVVFLVVDQTP